MDDQERDPAKFPLVRGKVAVFAVLGILFSLALLIGQFIRALY